MSFRDNLQHLRDTRNMTQSELAMLVGVSRQSVAKWEAEKSYPEMDKLLKLCDLFECTLDDLVRGDLTGRAPDPTRSLPEDAPPVDACGYDEHMRRRAWTVPAGLAMFVAGFGVAIAFSNMNGANPGARPYIAYFACATVGFALLIRAFAVHGSFRRRHPYIEDFYTDDQREAQRRRRARPAVRIPLLRQSRSYCFGRYPEPMGADGERLERLRDAPPLAFRITRGERRPARACRHGRLSH